MQVPGVKTKQDFPVRLPPLTSIAGGGSELGIFRSDLPISHEAPLIELQRLRRRNPVLGTIRSDIRFGRLELLIQTCCLGSIGMNLDSFRTKAFSARFGEKLLNHTFRFVILSF